MYCSRCCSHHFASAHQRRWIGSEYGLAPQLQFGGFGGLIPPLEVTMRTPYR